MSKYTTELRYICETMSGLSESVDGASVEEVIASSLAKIFDFDFPIFDEQYRSTLETKIIRHFYTREIGFETAGLWKLKLKTKLNEIMPYYNQLYSSELLEFNPLYDVNYTRSGSESVSTSESVATSLSTSESESESTSGNTTNSLLPEQFQWTFEQDTPQNGLSGIAEMTYLTRATKVQNGGTEQDYEHRNNQSASERAGATAGNTNKLALDTKGYLESIVGYKSNNPSKLLEDYRDTFLNIDTMIIGELEELFLYLW